MYQKLSSTDDWAGAVSPKVFMGIFVVKFNVKSINCLFISQPKARRSKRMTKLTMGLTMGLTMRLKRLKKLKKLVKERTPARGTGWQKRARMEW